MKYIYENGKLICHRTWFKITFNPILRKIQFWTDYPYVIASNIENDKCIGYVFTRVKWLGKI